MRPPVPRQDLTGLPPNLEFLIPIEPLQDLHNLFLILLGTSVTQIVHHLVADQRVGVKGEFENPRVEFRDVREDFARAQRLKRF